MWTCHSKKEPNLVQYQEQDQAAGLNHNYGSKVNGDYPFLVGGDGALAIRLHLKGSLELANLKLTKPRG